MKNTTGNVMAALLAIFLAGSFIYGSIVIGKKLSYEWWYESYVEQTIREMVNPEYLNR